MRKSVVVLSVILLAFPTLAQLSQLPAIFGIFAIIFVVKSCISIAEL